MPTIDALGPESLQGWAQAALDAGRQLEGHLR
jgi:hypothetical protein